MADSSREKWEELARKELGAAADHPFVQKMLALIDDEDLWYALEERGAVHAGTAKILTREQVTQATLEIFERNLVKIHGQ